MIPDGELLRRYADEGSESAFTELVQRHINVVYRAALRRVGSNAHAADDVTQRVFTDLARKAKSLKDRPQLGGWLYTGTRFASAELVRSEQRRRTHEQEAQAMQELDSTVQTSPGQLDPVLDEVMDLLEERDRDAVLLHYFEGHTFSEVGSLLSLSADAARMRVHRALDRLRTELSRRGLTSTSAALATMLASQTGASAAATMATTVAGRALAQAAAGSAAGGGVFWQWVRSILASKAAPAAVAVAAAGVVVAFLAPKDKPLPGPSAPPPPVSPAPIPAPAAIEQQMEFVVVQNLPPLFTVAAPPVSFAQLGENEKMLLKQLAAMHDFFGTPPERALAFLVTAEAPRYSDFSEGRDRLAEKGFVGTGPNGGAYLTAAGMDFVERHQAQVTAYEKLYKEPATMTRVLPANAPLVSDLTASEMDVLKKLWTIQLNGASPPPGMRSSFLLQLEDPDYGRFVEGRDLLAARKLVVLGVPRGGAILTNLGIAFCQAHEDEIDSYPLYYNAGRLPRKAASAAGNPGNAAN